MDFRQIINEFTSKTSSKIILDRVLLSLDINPYSLNVKITKNKSEEISRALNIHVQPIKFQIRFLKNVINHLKY